MMQLIFILFFRDIGREAEIQVQPSSDFLKLLFNQFDMFSA